MKISDILKRGKKVFSCEFFPPKTDEAMAQLYATAAEIKSLGAGFVSVTYGAGGSTRQKTIEIVRRLKNDQKLECMAHLTCVGHSRGELREILDQIRDAGIENVIALRGDPPKGETKFTPHPDGFTHAAELVEFIKSNYNFCVAAAGYPEGHVESSSRESDWTHLERKVKSGADVVITQLFFDNRDFTAFERRMREKGVTVPIVPGIMPITNFSQLVRFTEMCGAKIPPEARADLEPIKDDAEAVQRYGVEYATRQCAQLLSQGAPGLHFYTINRSNSTMKIVENLKKLRLLE